MTWRASLGAAVVLAAGVVGCTCQPTAVMPGTEREPAAVDPAVETEALPRASRDELPELTPLVTITAREEGFEVSNRTLVASWPDVDRARLSDAVVELEVPASTEALEVPALADAMRRAREVERARAEGGGTAIVFALRAAPGVAWRRVSQAIWSAGRTGWTEPRLVLRGEGEREVVLALPSRDVPSAAELRRIEAELTRALGGLVDDGLAPDDGAPEGDAPAPRSTYAVTVSSDRAAVITLGGRPLTARCDALSDTPAPLPARGRTIDTDALARCLDEARDALSGGSLGSVVVEAAPSLPYGDLVPVLEALAARAPVSFRAAP